MDEFGNFGPYFGQTFPQNPSGGTQPLLGVPQRTAAAVKVVVPRKKSEEEIMRELEETYDQYQIVRKEYYPTRFNPVMTVKDKAITFNNTCITKLEEAVYVQMRILPEMKTMLIRPCKENDYGAVRWCTVKDDKRKSRTISCEILTDKLFALMSWDKTKRYKLQARQIPSRGEMVYYIDLNDRKEEEKGRKKGSQENEYPESWKETFGMTVEEYEKKMADESERINAEEEKADDANDTMA